MSAVRMCDKCGEIFSEREDFSTYDGRRIVRDSAGARRVEQEQLDACEKCTNGTPQKPRLALLPSEKETQPAA